jgi:hypothetical protein
VLLATNLARQRRRIQAWLTRWSTRTPAPDPASLGSRRASARWPSRRAGSQVRRRARQELPAVLDNGRTGCAVRTSRRAPASKLARLRGRRLAASSWSRCISIVAACFQDACSAAGLAGAKENRGDGGRSGEPSQEREHMAKQPALDEQPTSACPCAGHRCGPTKPCHGSSPARGVDWWGLERNRPVPAARVGYCSSAGFTCRNMTRSIRS